MNQKDSFLFVDEIEHNENNNPVITYIGVLISKDQLPIIDSELKKLLNQYQIYDFHANEIYRNDQNTELMQRLSDLLLDNDINWFSFSFKRKWVKEDLKNSLKEVNFGERSISRKNYKAIGGYYFLVQLNSVLPDNKIEINNIAVFFDSSDGWFKKDTGIYFKNKIKHIKDVISSKRNEILELILPDHLGYIFGKCLRELPRNNDNIDMSISKQNSEFTNKSLKLLLNFEEKGLFHFLDSKEWLNNELNKTMEMMNGR